MDGLTTSEVARRADVNIDMVRYYEPRLVLHALEELGDEL